MTRCTLSGTILMERPGLPSTCEKICTLKTA